MEDVAFKGKKKRESFKSIALQAYELMLQARHMAITYDEHRSITKYVHSTSRGHEAIQLATGMQLQSFDFAAPYYRDESMLLGMGFSPYQLMLQLLAKKDDPFSGGRSYYSHPASNDPAYPTIPNQSSATGMQAIPATGMAQGVQYLENKKLLNSEEAPVVLCSLGDGSVTEGEVSEAFQFAALKELPIIYLIQDNDWGISVSSDEARCMDAYEYIQGFKQIKAVRVDGSDFEASYKCMKNAIKYVREKRKPILVHAKVPLLGHHTSGVRKEWYRTEEDLAKHGQDDPTPKLRKALIKKGIKAKELDLLEEKVKSEIAQAFQNAVDAPSPDLSSLYEHEFVPTPITEESGTRCPDGGKKVVMVDAALFAMDEIMRSHPDAVFYGQDVGRRLGGVFREAATLAEKYGDDRVFNTAIQEAYLVGSTLGMSTVGCKPVVEIQFADYIWPGINQLVTELSKACYLSMGKTNAQSLIRIPIGAYGGGGPYHSGCIESSVLSTRGIKVVFPSNAADMKGLLKAAFHDPNPVVFFEHKGLYWSKVPGTEAAKTVEPAEDYIVPLGKARIAQEASVEKLDQGDSLCIITYGMGVHWSLNASKSFPGQVEIVDLRTLYPMDEEAVFAAVRRHNKCIVLTEEQSLNSMAEALAGRISMTCFEQLDAPVQVMGAANMPAIPLNIELEKEMLPNDEKLSQLIEQLLSW